MSASASCSDSSSSGRAELEHRGVTDGGDVGVVGARERRPELEPPIVGHRQRERFLLAQRVDRGGLGPSLRVVGESSQNASARVDKLPDVRTLVSLVAGRRSKWVVIAVWIVAVVRHDAARLRSSRTRPSDDTASFLPESAESTEVVELLDDRFAAAGDEQGLIVYQRDGGLTAADKRRSPTTRRRSRRCADDELPLIGAADAAVRQGRRRKEPRLRGRLARLHGPDRADRLRERRPTGATLVRDTTGSEADGMDDQAHRRPRLQHRRRARSSATSTRSCCSRPCCSSSSCSARSTARCWWR